MWIVQYEGFGWSKPMTTADAAAYIREMDSFGYTYSDSEEI
jgi:hypothetical protein